MEYKVFTYFMFFNSSLECKFDKKQELGLHLLLQS